MPSALQLARGTREEHLTYANNFFNGEVTAITNENGECIGEIRVHDGVTPGGFTIGGRASSILDDDVIYGGEITEIRGTREIIDLGDLLTRSAVTPPSNSNDKEIKAFGLVTATASGSESVTGFGFSNVTRISQGVYELEFEHPTHVTSADYAIFGSVTTATTVPLQLAYVNGDVKDTTKFRIRIVKTNVTLANGVMDYPNWSNFNVFVI